MEKFKYILIMAINKELNLRKLELIETQNWKPIKILYWVLIVHFMEPPNDTSNATNFFYQF